MEPTRQEIKEQVNQFLSQGNKIKRIASQDVNWSESSIKAFDYERFHGGSQDPFIDSFLLTIKTN